MTNQRNLQLGRRTVLASGGALAALPIVGAAGTASAQPHAAEQRRLGGALHIDRDRRAQCRGARNRGAGSAPARCRARPFRA